MRGWRDEIMEHHIRKLNDPSFRIPEGVRNLVSAGTQISPYGRNDVFA